MDKKTVITVTIKARDAEERSIPYVLSNEVYSSFYENEEDYVSGYQGEGGGETPPVNPPEETVKPQVGDYVLYEPDAVSSP